MSERPPFQTKVLRATSIGNPSVALGEAPRKRAFTYPTQGGKTVNPAGGASDGRIIFQDCDGAEVGRLEWQRGKITTTGEQTIKTGCDDSSSYPGT